MKTRTDTDRLRWIATHQATLRPNRHRTGEVWWTCISPFHPMPQSAKGVRAAIDFAMDRERPPSADAKPAGVVAEQKEGADKA